jgi:serine/threonine protein kinase
VRRVARRTPRSELHDTLRLLLKIADAVHHAHQRGVIHRDLKPSNILVDAAGEPHVLDFGLAKIVSGRPRFESGMAEGMRDAGRAPLTDTQGFVGTPAYAAPERLLEARNAVDVRSDVYALGVLLYQMLTGRLPYAADGGLAALLDAVRQTDPLPPSAVLRIIRLRVPSAAMAIPKHLMLFPSM